MNVIILDDSQTIRQIIEIYLDELELDEEEIASFEDGHEALDFIKENGADIVFSDINMPKMSGSEFAKALFQFRPDLQKSFFVISGDESGKAIKEMKEVGAKRFLKKPIVEEHFNHFIKKEIERIRLQAKYNYLGLKQQEEMIDKYVIQTRTNIKGYITYASSAFCDISGYSKKELIGQPHNLVRHPDMPQEVFADLWETIKSGQIWQGEIKNLRKDGTFYWVHATVSPVKDTNGNVVGYSSIRLDISDKKKVEELAITDLLTQIYNRVHLDKVLGDELAKSKRYETPFSIILLDVDKFKSVNDTYGHQVGDSVLVETAQVLKDNIREVDTLGRWGGEEFLIIAPETTSEDAVSLAQKLRKALESFNFTTIGTKTASFGVSSYKDGDTYESLIERADQALYKAKENGRNRVELLD